MIDKFTDNTQDSGVSPVIGVILMIAITVILGAVIGFYAVELGGSTSSNVNAGIQTEETSDGVEVRWTSSGNAERVYVLVNGSEVEGAELSGVGGSMTVSAGENDTVSVVGVDADGNETELQSVTAESDTTDDSGEPQLVSGGSNDSESSSGPSEPNSESGSVTVSNLEGDGSSSNPYVITNDQELQAMRQDLDANYVLGNDIDASLTNEWNSGSGFDPVGSSTTAFTGSFDGKGYSISGLTIDRTSENIGLFGEANGSTIQNVSLENVDIDSNNDDVGGLVGYGDGVTISNSSVSGTITVESSEFRYYAGLLAGKADNSTVENTSSSGTVTGSYYIGGLIGDIDATDLSDSHSSADVNAEHHRSGGLIGTGSRGSVTNSYATGNVSGAEYVGGLMGGGINEVTISDTYATGIVTSEDGIMGGLVGEASTRTEINTSYSTGEVSGSSRDVGGLVGRTEYNATVTDSYWDTESSGQSSSAAGGTGLTTSEMQGSTAESNMSGLDFTNTWTTVDADYPDLSGEN